MQSRYLSRRAWNMARGIPVAVYNHSFPKPQALVTEDSWKRPEVQQKKVTQLIDAESINRLVIQHNSKKTKDRQLVENALIKAQNVQASQKPSIYSQVIQLSFYNPNRMYFISPQALSLKVQQKFLPFHPMYRPLASKSDPIVIAIATPNYPSESFTHRLIKPLDDDAEELKPYPQVTELPDEQFQSEVSMPETKKVTITLKVMLDRLKNTFDITPKEINADRLKEYKDSLLVIKVPTSTALLLKTITDIEKPTDENIGGLNYEAKQLLLQNYLALYKQLNEYKQTLTNDTSVQSIINIRNISPFLVVFEELEGQIKVKLDTLKTDNNQALLDITLSDDLDEFFDCEQGPEEPVRRTQPQQTSNSTINYGIHPDGFNKDDYDTDDEILDPAEPGIEPEVEEPEELAEVPSNYYSWGIRALLTLGTIGVISYLSRSCFTQGTSNAVEVVDINATKPDNFTNGLQTTNTQNISCPVECDQYWGLNNSYNALFGTDKEVDLSGWEALLDSETSQKDVTHVVVPTANESYSLNLSQPSLVHVFTHQYERWTTSHLLPAPSNRINTFMFNSIPNTITPHNLENSHTSHSKRRSPMSHSLSAGPIPILDSKPFVTDSSSGQATRRSNTHIIAKNWQIQNAARQTMEIPTTGNEVITQIDAQPIIPQTANSWVVDITADQFALLTPHLGKLVNALTAYGTPSEFSLSDNLVFRWFDPHTNGVFTFDVNEFLSSNSSNYHHPNATGELQVSGNSAHRNLQCPNITPSLALVPISAIQQDKMCFIEPTSPYSSSNMTAMVYPAKLPTYPSYENTTSLNKSRIRPISDRLRLSPTSHGLSAGPIPVFDSEVLITNGDRGQYLGHSKPSDTAAHDNAPNTTIPEEEQVTSNFMLNVWYNLITFGGTIALHFFNYAQHQSRKKQQPRQAHADITRHDIDLRQEVDAIQVRVADLEQIIHNQPTQQPRVIDLSDGNQQLPKTNPEHIPAICQLRSDVRSLRNNLSAILDMNSQFNKQTQSDAKVASNSVPKPQKNPKNTIGIQTEPDAFVPPVTNKTSTANLLEINGGDHDGTPVSPRSIAGLQHYSIFANIDCGLKDPRNSVKSPYANQEVFSTDTTPILTINYPKETYLTPGQQQSLESDGLTVSSNTGVPYKLIHKESLEPCAILTKEDLSCLLKETTDKGDNSQISPEDEYQQRLAMTVMNMIDNVASKSLKMDIKTTEPFAKKIAEKYIGFLKSQEGIYFNETITCTINDDTQEHLAIACFDKLITSRAEEVVRQNPAIKSIRQFQEDGDYNDDESSCDAGLSKNKP